jgi:F-type H+-transporting ATPase subunit a
MHVSLAAETLFYLGSFPVTNSLFTLVLIFFAIIISAVWVKSHLSYEHPAKWQLILEMIVSLLYGLVHDVLGDAKGKILFPFLFNFFAIIIVCNWFGLLPFVPAIAVNKDNVATTSTETSTDNSENMAITFASCFNDKNCYLTVNGIEKFQETADVFRAPSSDLSFTVALALISIFVTNFLGFKYLKLSYAKRYIDTSNPMNFLVGVIELFSEISKVISFSFRLFGNVFAGELLILVITTITLGIATLPFYALELFVGLIQAFVFFMLTTVFISVAVNTEH